MKERLNWGPLQAGRFASGHALAVFTGSLLAGRLIQVFGKYYVSLTNVLTALAFFMWAKANSGWSLVASLLPLSFGTGALGASNGFTIPVTCVASRTPQFRHCMQV